MVLGCRSPIRMFVERYFLLRTEQDVQNTGMQQDIGVYSSSFLNPEKHT